MGGRAHRDVERCAVGGGERSVDGVELVAGARGVDGAPSEGGHASTRRGRGAGERPGAAGRRVFVAIESVTVDEARRHRVAPGILNRDDGLGRKSGPTCGTGRIGAECKLARHAGADAEGGTSFRSRLSAASVAVSV